MKLNISRSKLSNRFLSFLFSSPLLAVPIQLQQARMVCLPKPGKVKNYAVPVDGTRPITVLNVWWRLWVSTLCQSKGLKAWLKTALHPSIGAVANQDIFENLISIFDHFHQQGFLLTLDYSKAFDTISILTCLSPFLISMVGLPTLLASSMRFGAAKTDSFSMIITLIVNLLKPTVSCLKVIR